MKRFLAVLLAFLIPSAALAQGTGSNSPQARATFKKLFTTNGWFGLPAYQADPFTCNAASIRGTYYNTATNTVFMCNGTSFQAMVSGGPQPTLTASQLVVTNASKVFASNGTITTNALSKSVSSGATLAASALSDDGTKITATEPMVLSAGLQGNFQTFALTSGAAAATFVKVAIPSNSAANLLVEYVFEASTATPHVQAFGGMIGVNAVNVGGTITCTVGVPTTATQPALATDGGTLTNAITCADATGGVLNLLATDTSSITPTTNLIRYRLHALAATTLTATPQ